MEGGRRGYYSAVKGRTYEELKLNKGYEVIGIQHRFSNTKLSIKLMDFDFWALTEDMCPKKGKHISVVVGICWST